MGNVTGKAGQNVTIPVNVTSDDGKPFNGNVSVSLPDGSNQTVEIVNGTGKITWSIPDDYNGTYTDNADYPGNESYLKSNGTGTITVIPKIPTYITVGNITAYPGENVTIPINVTTDDPDEPFNGNITVELPDGVYKTVEIVNGTGTVTWSVPEDYTPDKYPDVIKFPGNEEYLASNGTGTVTVIPIPTHITVGNVTAHPGEKVSIPITVTADDEKPFNGNVTITLPDGTSKTVEIVNGSGKVKWTVPSDYTPDKYNDSVKFIGNNKYLPSNATGTVTVIKTPVDITVGNVTGKPGDDVTIPIEVVPRDGSVFNGKVTVELPDGTKKVVDIVNGKGKVSWTIPKDYKAGKYSVKVTFDGNNYYYPADGTGIVTVIVDQVEPGHNGTLKDVPPVKKGLAKHQTGNPIFALLLVLACLGVNIKRRK